LKPPSELEVLGLDGDSLGVDGAQIGVLEEGDEVGFRGFLKSLGLKEQVLSTRNSQRACHHYHLMIPGGKRRRKPRRYSTAYICLVSIL
jgi:hypothetical protein